MHQRRSDGIGVIVFVEVVKKDPIVLVSIRNDPLWSGDETLPSEQGFVGLKPQ